MPQRIAILTHEFPAVSETFVVDHVIGMERRGWTPTVVCSRIDAERLRAVEARHGLRLQVERVAPIRERIQGAGTHVARLALAAATHVPALASRHGRNAVIYAAALARTFRELRPDVVHAHFGPNGVAASIALRGRIPLVVDFHGYDFTCFTQAHGWGLYRRTLRNAAAIVVHSSFAEGRVQPQLGADVRHVQLGVDLSLFASAARANEWPSPLRLLVVGRLVFAKGVHVALEALAAVRRAPAPLEARLFIVGDGPERPRLEALTRALGLTHCVEFAGALPHEEIAREMAAASVLLVPSIESPDGAAEAFGRVAIEGLASGLPVIVSGVGGLPETVGDVGRVVPPGDADALASAVRGLVASDGPIQCGLASRTRASTFSIERMWDEYALIAREAAHGTGRTRRAEERSAVRP